MNLKKLLYNIDFNSNKNIDNIIINSITHNSKEVQEGSLFIAIIGQNSDGNDYIDEAINNGAIAIISNKNLQKKSIPYIIVKNPREIMSKISSTFYNNISKKMTIIGVTGTNGKTSICELINFILNKSNLNSCTIGTLGLKNQTGTLNTNFTTPESNNIHHYLNTMNQNNIKNAVIEVSSHALDLNRVDDIEFDIGIFSNLTPEHLDYHNNMDSYFQSKLKLFKKLKSNTNAIINIDNEYCNEIIKNSNCNVIKYSLVKKTDIFAKKFTCTLDGINATLNIFNENFEIKSSLLGEFNLLNILASIGACIALGIPKKKIIKSINLFQSIPGRLEKVPNKSQKNIFIDYAHTPDAYEKVLSSLKCFSNKQIITLFGCGGNRDASNRSKMASIAESFSSYVYITSDNPRNENINNIVSDITSGLKNTNYKINLNRKEAIKDAINMMTDDHILIIFGKGRENYQIIKNKKIYHNDFQIIKNFA